MKRTMPLRRLPLTLALAGALAALLAGCATTPYGEARRAADAGDYDRAVSLYYDEIVRDPASADAWRELGITYYRQGERDKAVEALNQANRIAPDARAHLFLGIIRETEGDLDGAADLYRYALALQPPRDTERLLRAHLQDVERQRAQAEARQAIAGERSLDASALPDNAVAVYPFDGSRLPEDMRPLATGLAELTALDLAKVKALKVVERVRMETLLKELSLGGQGAVEPVTAPRVGRLVGGRHIVSGALSGLPDERFMLNGSVVDVRDSTVVDAPARDGDLSKFFDVQKAFLMQVVDDLERRLHFELTREERDAIQQHPTEDLMALLAYGRGLEREDAGDLAGARSEFQRAARRDPGFQAAGLRAAQLSDLLAARRAGQTGAVAPFATAVAPPPAPEETAPAETDGGLAAFQSGAPQELGLVPPAGDVAGIYRDAPNNLTIFHVEDMARISVRGRFDR